MDNAKDNVERVCNILVTNGFDKDVVDDFRENKVDLDVFIQLDKTDIRELGVIALGDRKKLQQLIVKLQNSEKNNEKEAEGSNVSSQPLPSTSSSCSKTGGNLAYNGTVRISYKWLVSNNEYFILYRLQFQLAVSVKLPMSVMNQIQVQHSMKMTKV